MKQFFLILFFAVSIVHISTAQSTSVKISTTKGDMVIMLYDETPKHRDNFIKLVEDHYYDGLLFHRVINEFMIQGGDPNSKDAPAGTSLGNGGPGYTIEAEFNPKYFHKKGTLAAARMGDNVNPDKNSSGSQFYIVQGKVYTDQQLDMFEKQMGTTFTKAQRDAYCTVGGTPHLDGAYTVYGEVTEGLDVLDKIAAVSCDSRNRPQEDVKIISMEIINK
jgi:peptidyl-prolyl cis-trans isomerase B (cyclophilin B)